MYRKSKRRIDVGKFLAAMGKTTGRLVREWLLEGDMEEVGIIRVD